MTNVSVCIVTYNSADDITSCLNAVISQSFQVNEIIVLDNESRDQSAKLVAEFSDKFPQVRLYQNKKNNGFAGGQNQAIAAANGDYIVVLNPDVQLAPDYIKLTVEALEHDEKAGSATGLLKLASHASLVDTTGLHMPFNRHAVDRGMGDDVNKWQVEDKVFGVSGAAAVYKREMIEAIKINGEFFDEHFFAYKEDVDVAWRAQLLGWHALYVPKATGLHARGWKKGGRNSISLFVRQHSYVNQIFMIIKNEQINFTFTARFFVLLARELIKFTYIVLKERDMLSSYSKIKLNFNIMKSKRRCLQMKIKQFKSGHSK